MKKSKKVQALHNIYYSHLNWQWTRQKLPWNFTHLQKKYRRTLKCELLLCEILGRQMVQYRRIASILLLQSRYTTKERVAYHNVWKVHNQNFYRKNVKKGKMCLYINDDKHDTRKHSIHIYRHYNHNIGDPINHNEYKRIATKFNRWCSL